MAFKGRRTRDSHYPRYLFHGLRCAQLIASIVVSGIMAYFMYYLREGHYSIPWTFILLLTISLLTMLSLLVTILLYNLTYLSPRFNLMLNGSISLGWALGLALLSWSISTSGVLAKTCSVQIWHGEAEAGVCRDYKALWAMTLCGTVSTFLALLLDIHTHRAVTRRGAYVLPEDDKDAQRLNDMKSMRVRSAGYEAPREQSAVTERGMAWQNEREMDGGDIGYHNRYGAEEEVPSGPLDGEGRRDMGYHNRFFRD